MKSHWLVTYVMANDTRITESTKDRGVPEATEEEVRAGLEEGLVTSLTRGGVTPLVWVRDRVRDGASTLIFTAQVLYLELARDLPEECDPEGLKEEADRHLRAVQDPGPQDPEVRAEAIRDWEESNRPEG